jgi:hypothetical protein
MSEPNRGLSVAHQRLLDHLAGQQQQPQQPEPLEAKVDELDARVDALEATVVPLQAAAADPEN